MSFVKHNGGRVDKVSFGHEHTPIAKAVELWGEQSGRILIGKYRTAKKISI